MKLLYLIVWSFTEGRRDITLRAGIRWNLAIVETWLLLCHLSLAITLQLPSFLPTQWRNLVTAAAEAKRFSFRTRCLFVCSETATQEWVKLREMKMLE